VWPFVIQIIRGPRSSLRHGLEHSSDSRAESPEFLQVRRRKLFDPRLAQRRQPHLDPPSVGFGPRAAHKALANQTVDEANRAMVAQLEALGELANRDEIASGKPLDRKQGLVLLRRKACSARGIPAEPVESAQGMAQFGEQLVVDFLDGGVRRDDGWGRDNPIALYIVMRSFYELFSIWTGTPARKRPQHNGRAHLSSGSSPVRE